MVMIDYPKSVVIEEQGLRDGFQNLRSGSRAALGNGTSLLIFLNYGAPQGGAIGQRYWQTIGAF